MSIWQTNSWKNLILKSHQANDVFEIDWILIEKRSLGLWQFGLFALWVENLEKINEGKLIELCKKENCLFVQVETFEIPPPSLPLAGEEPIFSPPARGELEGGNFKPWYYKKFITPYTAIIDLSKSIEEIFALMKPKWRYNIWLAEKKWVEVLQVEKSDENIKIFYNLMFETTSRDWFNGNKIDYYKDFLEIIPNSELIFTKFEWKILSAWIFVFDKEVSIYYYWASTSDKEFRNLMAPYLMQSYAIKKAKSIESKYYDFLWVSSPGDEKSSLVWVTDFKLKFTPDVRKVSESYIWINKKFLYFIIQILKKIKSSLS